MKKAKPTIPTENDEAKALATMLRYKGYLFSHIVNESQTKQWGAIQRAKAMGKNPGVPDYIVIKGNELIFVELKRTRGGRVSPEQLVWIGALKQIKKVRAAICRGADEAIKFIG
jgi:ribosomal protein L39E